MRCYRAKENKNVFELWTVQSQVLFQALVLMTKASALASHWLQHRPAVRGSCQGQSKASLPGPRDKVKIYLVLYTVSLAFLLLPLSLVAFGYTLGPVFSCWCVFVPLDLRFCFFALPLNTKSLTTERIWKGRSCELISPTASLGLKMVSIERSRPRRSVPTNHTL